MNYQKFRRYLFLGVNLFLCLFILPIFFWLGRFYERRKERDRKINLKHKESMAINTTKRVKARKL